MVTASAVSAFGLLIMEPVTTISWSSDSGAAVISGACCAVARIVMATTHTHANDATVNGFTSDVTLISFRILIFVPLGASYGRPGVCDREDSPLCWRDMKTKAHRSNVMNDSGPPRDEMKMVRRLPAA